MLHVLPDVHHGIVEVVVHGKGSTGPAAVQFPAFGLCGLFLELRAVLVDEVLVAERHGVEASARTKIIYGFRLLKGRSVGPEPYGAHRKMGLVVNCGLVSFLLL